MRKFWSIALLIALVAVFFVLGTRFGPRRGPSSGLREGASRPEGVGAGPADVEPSDLPPGTVTIDRSKRQEIGVRVEAVARKPFSHTLHAFGRVAADERRLFVVNAATDGLVMTISSATSGALLMKDEAIASFYAPEVWGIEQSFFNSLNTRERLKESPNAPSPAIETAELNIALFRENLRNIGMGDKQIAQIAKTRERVQRVDMCAPATGILLSRSVFLGLKFVKGQELFRLADLSRVWILADVFEGEDRFLPPQTMAKISLPGQQKTLDAVVSRVLPLFDSGSRSLKVRLEAGNPGYLLRPDMFVDVDVPILIPEAIAVPSDAILDSGLRKTVFVERGAGIFTPRQVETGLRLGGWVEIVKGLEPGERIAVSGTFLIDSESRMGLAAEGWAGSPDLESAAGKDGSVSTSNPARGGEKK